MKKVVRHLLIASILFFFSGNSIAQSACNWKQGDMVTYDQGDYGDAADPAVTLLLNNYNTVYFPTGGTLRVGIGYSISFNAGLRVVEYLPASGTHGVLTGNITNPTSTSAGVFGGTTVALHINVNFSDAGVIGGTIKLGDLVVYGLAEASLNGMTLREVLTVAESILGGSSSLYSPDVISPIISDINASFLNGTPSQFALDHLKRGWKQGDFKTYTQANLDVFPDPQLIFTQPNYNTVYGSNGGVVEIGIPGASGFSMQFTGIDAGVRGYLVTGGSPSSLTADLINPTSSPSGTFGGDVLVLTLTIDFSDAGFMNGNANIPYGDLVLTNFQNNLSSLNGLTVRQFNSLANILLGGGSNGYTISDIAPITAQLTAAFSDAPAPPTQFALDHLKRVWQQGDYITRTQDQWDATTNWYTAYNQIYASTFGTVQIGLDPSLGYRIRFSDGSRVSDYLTQSGTPAALTQDLDDPTSSSSAQFGAEILALTMNIDWSDAGETPNVNGIHFGDLILQNMTANPELNGLSVREVMDIANTLLGGGTSFISIAAINDVVGDLNYAFSQSTLSTFAQNSLIIPCETVPINHCPTTTSLTVTTAPGTQVLIPLQAADADNDLLTFTITQNPVHGSISTNLDGTFSYTPNAGFAGKDTLLFNVSDGKCEDKDTVFISVECPTSTLWKQGDYNTRSQLVWNGDATWYGNYDAVYAAQSGIVEVGIPGNAGYSLRFAAGDEVNAFFIQSGTPAALNADLFSTTGSSSGQFGGEVLALRLNIDFSKAGVLSSNSSVPFDDLILHDLSSYNAAPLPELNGLSVKEVMAIANFMLGGGSSTFEFSTITHLVTALNTSFIDGTPSSFAKDHLLLPCSSNHCPVTFSSSVTKPVNTAFNVELQATDEDNNSLVYSVYQLPAHGTVSITDSIAHYTPATGYYGNDIFLFNVTDGKCNVQDTVYITIVVCPQQQGYWKNNSAAWPASATPMLLGTVSYTKSQLITILKTPVGTGNKADASLILAYQLIAVKLSIANGTPVPQSIADAIAAANVLIGSNKIPMNIRTNSTVGKQMVKLADLFSNYLAGTMTPGCGAAAARTAFNDNVAPVIPSLISLQQNYPNPFSKTTVIRYALPEVSHVTLNVYNFTGQKVATLVDGMQKAGYSSVVFNAGALPAGVYFCRMQSGDFTATIKMVQVK